jgi:F0F1-type ATP synthase assembly protein I
MSRWVAALRLMGVGFYVGICIVGGTLAGWWLGNEKPLFMILGLLVGLVVASLGVYQMIRPLMSDKQDKEDS